MHEKTYFEILKLSFSPHFINKIEINEILSFTISTNEQNSTGLNFALFFKFSIVQQISILIIVYTYLVITTFFYFGKIVFILVKLFLFLFYFRRKRLLPH